MPGSSRWTKTGSATVRIPALSAGSGPGTGITERIRCFLPEKHSCHSYPESQSPPVSVHLFQPGLLPAAKQICPQVLISLFSVLLCLPLYQSGSPALQSASASPAPYFCHTPSHCPTAHRMAQAAASFSFPDSLPARKPSLLKCVTLPEYINTDDMMKEALDRKVAYVPSSAFYANEPKFNQMRLSFVTVPPEKIDEGVKVVAELVKEKMAAHNA